MNLFNFVLSLHRLDEAIDLAEFYVWQEAARRCLDESRIETLVRDDSWNPRAVRDRNYLLGQRHEHITASSGGPRTIKLPDRWPHDWAFRGYEFRNDSVVICDSGALRGLAKLDVKIDILEWNIWDATRLETRNDDQRRRLLSQGNWGIAMKMERDGLLIDRNCWATRFGLPWRHPHGWDDRKYKVDGERVIVYR